jgi:hypothetical protein
LERNIFVTTDSLFVLIWYDPQTKRFLNIYINNDLKEHICIKIKIPPPHEKKGGEGEDGR